MKNNIKVIRKLRNMTQAELGARLGVTKQVIAIWENKVDEKIPKSRLQQIAVVLRVSVDYLKTKSFDLTAFEIKSLSEQLSNEQPAVEVDHWEVERMAKQARLNDLEYINDLKQQHSTLENMMQKLAFDPDKISLLVSMATSLNINDDLTWPREEVLELVNRLFKMGGMSRLVVLIDLLRLLMSVDPENDFALSDDFFDPSPFHEKIMEALRCKS